jgi:hypothetical protein
MIDIVFAILLVIIGILVPANVMPTFAYYFIWFMYYIYVINQTLSVTDDNCKCNIGLFTKSIVKSIVILIFGLLVFSSLLLFNQLCHGENDLISMEELIKYNIILIIAGALAFFIFNINLSNDCKCNNADTLSMINIFNFVIVFLQSIFVFLLI